MLLKASPDGIWHHEDFILGQALTFGSKTVTKDEIIAFARAYDPQPIHIDEEAAKQSIVGGLCASGFHSCAILMRILCDGILTRSSSLGSPGIDTVKWLLPVRPGDILSARLTCTEKRNLASRPDVGVSKMLFEMLNHKSEVVMSWNSNQFMRRRHPSATTQPSSPAPRAATATTAAVVDNWSLGDAPEPNRTANFFEDRHVGEIYDLGRHTFTRDEIIAFAREFDPQPFHLD